MRLGDGGDRPAITWDGRTWSYRELDGMVRERALQLDRDQRVPVRITGLPVVDAMASLFAAASRGRPVLVAEPAGPTGPAGSANPAGPASDPGPLPDGTFLVAVTSGTSGHPRSVLRSAESWIRSFRPFAELTGIGRDDRVLLTGPLHATLHLFAAVHTLAWGAELTDRPEQATAVHAVPSVLTDLLAGLPDGAQLRAAVVAGSALPDELGEQAGARNVVLTEYYGAAELSFVAARRYPEPLRPFPGAHVELREGTLWVRSPYLATGYPAGVTGPFRRDGRGFATVGDLADSTAAGGLIIRGRGDAAITTGGATVIAEDVEAALAALPMVAGVAVVGVPHQRLGQVVTAVVEPRPGIELTGLRAAARQVLGGPALPRRWLVAARLPRTPSGKVARHRVALAAAALVAGEPTGTALPLRPLP